MKNFVRLVAFALLVSSFAFSQALRIGTLNYGNFVPDPTGGTTGSRAYLILVDTRVFSNVPLTFGNVRLTVNGTVTDLGPVMFYCWAGYCGTTFHTNGQAACPKGCTSLTVQYFTQSGLPLTIPLLNGTTFTTWAVNTTVMQPPVGKAYLKDNQTVYINLQPDPKGK